VKLAIYFDNLIWWWSLHSGWLWSCCSCKSGWLWRCYARKSGWLWWWLCAQIWLVLAVTVRADLVGYGSGCACTSGWLWQWLFVHIWLAVMVAELRYMLGYGRGCAGSVRPW